jgi:SOS response regulatory protein OraA/RecX
VIEGESAKKLLQKAGRLLARRAYSRGELEAKLRSQAEEKEIQAVLGRLEELNLLNDEQYAYNFAHCRMRQEGWGPLKVLHALLRREVASHLAESAIERVRQETGDGPLLQEYLEGYCTKHGLPQDRKAIQKLVSRLRRRGFQEEIIYGILRQKIPAAVWRRFDTGD